jgi:hypothetical protein
LAAPFLWAALGIVNLMLVAVAKATQALEA